MYENVRETQVHKARYGWILLIGSLIYVITVFQSPGSYFNKDVDFHPEEANIEQGVTLTASGGYISAHTSTTDNSNWYSVVSDSTVPVDAEARAEDGHIVFTYKGLLPGNSFYFQSENPCLITISAS